MPATQCVEHLMHDDSYQLTTAPNGDVLGASNPTNIRETPAGKIIFLYTYSQYLL